MQLVETIYGYKKDVTIGKILTGTYSDFRISGFCVHEGTIKFDVMENHLDDKKPPNVFVLLFLMLKLANQWKQHSYQLGCRLIITLNEVSAY